MIFNIRKDFYQKESNKERNLYYKIFAGYFFNKFIVGWEQRKYDFIILLTKMLNDQEHFIDKMHQTKRAIKLLHDLNNSELFITFDYHASQELKNRKDVDRGEMSDILIWGESCFISVECKFLENMDINNDVIKVQKRIDIVKKQMKINDAIQVLLMKKSKWDNSIIRSGKNSSFVENLKKANFKYPVIVLFWEDIASLIKNKEVKEYLEKQIKRTKKS